jgi:GNAT superfamily N-acetyltransferase
MGTWGPGNFQDDRARDWLWQSAQIPLVKTIESELKCQDEGNDHVIMAAVEVLTLLCEQLNAIPPEPEEVTKWRVSYVRAWKCYIDNLDPEQDYKKQRLEVINATFDRLLTRSRKWHERKRPNRDPIMHVRPFGLCDEAAVIALWERCGLTRPWNDPRKDIRRKLRVRPDYFLVGVLDGAVVATAMIGYDGHRGWIYYLGVDPDRQNQGLGRAIMAEAERLLREAGCPKINLQVRTTNQKVIDFYRRLGYAPDDVVSLGKRLERDGAGPA